MKHSPIIISLHPVLWGFWFAVFFGTLYVLLGMNGLARMFAFPVALYTARMALDSVQQFLRDAAAETEIRDHLNRN